MAEKRTEPFETDCLGPRSGLIALAVLWVALGWTTFAKLGAVYQNNDDYSHGFLVPLVAAYAAYESRKKWTFSSQGGWIALPLVILGALLVVFSRWHALALGRGSLIEPALCGVGLVACAAAVCLSMGGTVSWRTWAFPVCFLLLAAPAPQAVALRVTVPLRAVVSSVSASVIGRLGVDVLREGNVLHLANASLGVADACSGMRSLLVLLALAAALAYWMRLGVIRGAALLLLSFPVAVAGNVARVTLTSLLVRAYGAPFASGWRHEACGWLSFALGLAALAALGWLLSRIRPRGSIHKALDGPGDPPPPAPPPPLAGAAVLIPIIVAGVMLAAEGATLVVARRYAAFQGRHFLAVDRRPFADFPRRIEDYATVAEGGLSEWESGMIKPSDKLVRVYQAPAGPEVTLTMLYWLPQLSLRSDMAEGPHSPDVCYPSFGWRPVWRFSKTIEEPDAPGGSVNVRLFHMRGRSVVVLFGYRGGKTPLSMAARIPALIRSWNRPEPIGAFYYYTVATSVRTTPEAALDTANDFLLAIAPILPEYGIGASGSEKEATDRPPASPARVRSLR